MGGSKDQSQKNVCVSLCVCVFGLEVESWEEVVKQHIVSERKVVPSLTSASQLASVSL